MTSKKIHKKQNTKDETKAPPVKKSRAKNQTKTEVIPRLLCFSNIDSVKVQPYTFLENILNQSYKEAHYIFNIFIESKSEESLYKKILKQFVNPTKIKINFLLKSINNKFDHFIGFSNFEYQSYNIFLYLDSSIIYLPNYISNLIKQYDYSDIYHIKFNNLSSNIGYNYILNNKSLDILIKNKTNTQDNWTSLIQEHNLSVKESETNIDILIPSIEQEIQKTPPSRLLKDSSQKDQHYKLIDNDFCTICIFEHNFWSSFVYLNKRNNRMYNIYNDDHGAFTIKDDNSIVINWDVWGEEIFYKKTIDNIYYYSIHR